MVKYTRRKNNNNINKTHKVLNKSRRKTIKRYNAKKRMINQIKRKLDKKTKRKLDKKTKRKLDKKTKGGNALIMGARTSIRPIARNISGQLGQKIKQVGNSLKTHIINEGKIIFENKSTINDKLSRQIIRGIIKNKLEAKIKEKGKSFIETITNNNKLNPENLEKNIQSISEESLDSLKDHPPDPSKITQIMNNLKIKNKNMDLGDLDIINMVTNIKSNKPNNQLSATSDSDIIVDNIADEIADVFVSSINNDKIFMNDDELNNLI